jgi:Ca2+-binding RTX toxin-like protein
MTTYTLNGFSRRIDWDAGGVYTDFAPTTFQTVRAPGDDALSYIYSWVVPGTPEYPALPMGELVDETSYATTVAGAPVLGDPDTFYELIFQDTYWGAGNRTQILQIFNVTDGIEHYFVLGGDPLPPMTSLADLNAFVDSITLVDYILDGPFAHGGDIPLAGLPGVVIEENDLIIGTDAADLLLGGIGNDQIDGGAGDDVIRGGDGDDVIDGGAGNNTIWGNAGNDTITVGAGSDFTRVLGGAGNDTIFGGSNFGDWLYGGSGDDTIHVGDNYHNQVFGGVGNDTFFGGAGQSFMWGEGGRDTLNGGTGQDVFHGGAGNDRAFGNDGDDELHGEAGNDLLDGGAGNDRLDGGDDRDVLKGGTGADMLYGGEGNDKLLGNAHGDRLDGGAGRDRLIGGNGADEFVMARGYERDTVVDFEDDRDTIVLNQNVLARPGMTAQEVLDAYGSIVDGDAVLSFGGGDRLTIQGVTDLQILVDDIAFI